MQSIRLLEEKRCAFRSDSEGMAISMGKGALGGTWSCPGCERSSMRSSRNRRRARADRGGGRMSRWKNRRRRTDYGTIVLHWTLVSLLVVSLVTGLRIASETPDRTWVNLLDDLLPHAAVWTAHMPAARSG